MLLRNPNPLMTPQNALKDERRVTFDFNILQTDDADAYIGGVKGTHIVKLHPTAIIGWSNLAKVYDQVRFDEVDMQLNWVHDDNYPGPIAGLFVYDPDGYTTASGSLMEHSNARRFVISMNRSSQTFRVQPGRVVEDMVKGDVFYDVGTAPDQNLGAFLFHAAKPPNGGVAQIKFQISFKIVMTFRGRR